MRHASVLACLGAGLCATACVGPLAAPPAAAAPRASSERPGAGVGNRRVPTAWTEIGRSLEGRPIEACTLGARGTRIYLIGGIHGDERPGGENVERLVAWWAASKSEGRVLRVVRDMNPDGTAAVRRGNARAVDLNRNWPAANFRASRTSGEHPLSEPETQAVWDDLEHFAPDFVLVFHAARSGPFVNYDGPALDAAQRFAAAASEVDARWSVVADMGYATPGSLGTVLGRERALPILTLELPRGAAPGEVWPALERGLAALAEGEL